MPPGGAPRADRAYQEPRSKSPAKWVQAQCDKRGQHASTRRVSKDGVRTSGRDSPASVQSTQRRRTTQWSKSQSSFGDHGAPAPVAAPSSGPAAAEPAEVGTSTIAGCAFGVI